MLFLIIILQGNLELRWKKKKKKKKKKINFDKLFVLDHNLI